MLISDIVDFRAKNITRNNEGHFIMIKESIHEDNITALNTYASKNRILKYMKQKLKEQ